MFSNFQLQVRNISHLELKLRKFPTNFMLLTQIFVT